MNFDDIMGKLGDIFREVFDDEELTILPETNSDDIEDWDSLEQINLIIAIEKEFEIKFDLSEVKTLENVGQMAELIEKKLA